MKRAALILLVCIVVFVVALAGVLVGAWITVDQKSTPRSAMGHPLDCDARMVLSVAGQVLHDGCYVLKAKRGA